MQLRFDLRLGFPAVTTKKLAWRAVVSELLWFLEGSGSELRLKEILYGTSATDRSTIWSANANSEYWKPMAKTDGDLGRIYGVQWRHWRTPHRKWLNSSTFEPVVIDQLQELINGIKTAPDSRRHILTAWNPGELDLMALPPCHVMCQFDVTDGYLSCQLYQRSCDMFLGVPFNIASYSLLTHIIARECDLKVGDFIWTGGDCHIYKDHLDAVKEQLTREPKDLPTLYFTVGKKFDEYNIDDFKLENYDPHPAIVAPMSV
jgi:thymidylate synthase